MRKKKTTLEQILKKSDKKEYVKHHDPLHVVENHVVTLLFISLMFLTMIFVFVSAPPGTEIMTDVTGLAIDEGYEYSIDDFENDVNTESRLSKVLDYSKQNIADTKDAYVYLLTKDRNYLSILTYVFWLALFGLMISQKPHEGRK